MTEPAPLSEPAPPPGSDTSPNDEAPLVPPGNPLRPMAAIVAVLGLVVPFLLMTMDVHWTLSVPVGFAGIVVGAWGALDFAGAFDDSPDTR
ncbi:MAG TPA: hypothetical protein VF103_03670, partial [Polyangiaceae bacterium]